MAVELKPFFQDQGQADSFIEWVEECKWKFLTGGPSPAQTGSPTANANSPSQAAARAPTAASPAQAALAASPPTAAVTLLTEATATTAAVARARLTPNPVHDHYRPTPAVPALPVRPGPHVAVTSRCVLQPNPDFTVALKAATPPPPASPKPLPPTSGSAAAFSKAAIEQLEQKQKAAAQQRLLQQQQAKASPKANSLKVANGSSVSVVSVPSNPVKREKNELLENMTKQLQLILTKLNDKGLTDDTREKYQAMAQSIQMQMAKITKPQTAPPRRRR
eukprot:gnl/TRDRNA2_/TRDRNA2_129061_c0_seq1.p1 gnl/TRDRNA2_/TRDRNA2_129061_c0~~gnl/TRDRNA2_/TRDRNA2_129061_c0_seq1.p1  ORF type:complete len:285 (+),score=73.65 gnl/TRDRNA2_/TRDRNA2_129061_c0_seq1:25-855(+)